MIKHTQAYLVLKRIQQLQLAKELIKVRLDCRWTNKSL